MRTESGCSSGERSAADADPAPRTTLASDAAGNVERNYDPANPQTRDNYRTATVKIGIDGGVGGQVPATLSLMLGAPASFGAFVPGAAREYTASTTATVTSTAGDAALSVNEPGHLANGAFSLPSPLRVEMSPAAWIGPVSSASVAIGFRQAIGASDALRTGTYSKTFTLSTTNP